MPIAAAIASHAAALGVETVEPTDFVAAAGQGLQCLVEGCTVLLGNRSWMLENGTPLSEAMRKEEGPSSVYQQALGLRKKCELNQALAMLKVCAVLEGESRESCERPNGNSWENLDKCTWIRRTIFAYTSQYNA